MADIDKAIARVLEGYKTAVFAKDVASLMKLYDPKVRVFDAWGIWAYEGALAWQLAVEAWFSSLRGDSVKVTFDEIQVSGTPDFAVVSAIVTYAAVSAQGEQRRAMQNRMTWVLKTSGHVLRIIHEHTSAPIGFDDMKAILQRAKNT